jgi:hypothetical protein
MKNGSEGKGLSGRDKKRGEAVQPGKRKAVTGSGFSYE